MRFRFRRHTSGHEAVCESNVRESNVRDGVLDEYLRHCSTLPSTDGGLEPAPGGDFSHLMSAEAQALAMRQHFANKAPGLELPPFSLSAALAYAGQHCNVFAPHFAPSVAPRVELSRSRAGFTPRDGQGQLAQPVSLEFQQQLMGAASHQQLLVAQHVDAGLLEANGPATHAQTQLLFGGAASHPHQRGAHPSADACSQYPLTVAAPDRSPALEGLAREAAVAAAAAASAASTTVGRRSGKHVAAAAAAAAASRLIHAEAQASSTSRGAASSSSVNRRAWSVEEDETIRACVAQMGMRWRLIAPLLPGRSDDSVRNRWKRLKEDDSDCDVSSAQSAPVEAAASTVSKKAKTSHAQARKTKPRAEESEHSCAAASEGGDGRLFKEAGVADAGGGENGGRVSWSSHEDQVIVRAVQELGPRWCFVAARLPSRTDQAVRNRWNRLQQRARVQARAMFSRMGEPLNHPLGNAG